MLSESHEARLKLVQRRHGSLEKLGRVIGSSRSAVCRTLKGQSRNEMTQARIAKACNVSRRKMFGEAS